MTYPPIEQHPDPGPLWDSGKRVPKIGDTVRFTRRGECTCPVCGTVNHRNTPNEGHIGIVTRVVKGPERMYSKHCGHSHARNGHDFIVETEDRMWGLTCLAELEVIEEGP